MSETKTPKHEKKPFCQCKKNRYKSKEQAINHLHKIHNANKGTDKKLPLRAYEGNSCPYWHLTSQTIEEGIPGNYKPKLDWSKLLAA